MTKVAYISKQIVFLSVNKYLLSNMSEDFSNSLYKDIKFDSVGSRINPPHICGGDLKSLPDVEEI